MAKKKKRRIQAPSLSGLDKGIYYFLMGCCVFFSFLPLAPMLIHSQGLFFEDSHMIAQLHTGLGFSVFLNLFAGFSLAIILDWLRRKKQPIFGKSHITYGPPQWKNIYPLTHKQFWTNLWANKKRLAVGILCSFVIVSLIVSAALFGSVPRQNLYDDGHIEVYNHSNTQTSSYTPSDVAQIRIYTRGYHNRHRRPDTWGIEIEISMKDGEHFFFSYQNFLSWDDEIHGALSGISQIKAIFDPSIIIIEGTQDLQRVIWDMDLNQEEALLLYQIFEAGEPPLY